MRAVADTNVVISGLLWHGLSRRVLDAAREGKIELFTSVELLTELDDVLNREKFLDRLKRASVQTSDLVNGYAALATVVHPAKIDPVVLRDPDDDVVISCAVAAQANLIVSGDGDLLDLKQYKAIEILKASEILVRLHSGG